MAKPWVVDHTRNVATTAKFKVGSTSIRTCVEHAAFRNNDEVDYIPKRIVWIRHPLKRLISTYCYFKMMHESGATTGNKIPTGSWEEFVDYVLKNPNPHWDSQSENVEFATHVYKFEHINLLFPKFFGVKLDKKNVSADYPVDEEYRLDDIKTNWKEDFELWDSL